MQCSTNKMKQSLKVKKGNILADEDNFLYIWTKYYVRISVKKESMIKQKPGL